MRTVALRSFDRREGGALRPPKDGSTIFSTPNHIVPVAAGAQRGALQLHHLAATRVAPGDQVGDPDAIGIEALEIDAATKQQSLGHTALEMSVLTFNGAVLMRHPGVIAGWCHLVVCAQRLVATRLVDLGIVIEIAERGRQTVGAVLNRHAAERPL
jgi:hypothetical protein